MFWLRVYSVVVLMGMHHGSNALEAWMGELRFCMWLTAFSAASILAFTWMDVDPSLPVFATCLGVLACLLTWVRDRITTEAERRAFNDGVDRMVRSPAFERTFYLTILIALMSVMPNYESPIRAMIAVVAALLGVLIVKL